MTEKMDKQIRDFIENTMCELVEIERVKDKRNKAIIFVKFICDCGVEDRKKWLHFAKHPNCIKCNDRSKISVDEIKAKVNGFGHEFVSIEKKIIGKRKRVFVNFICKCDKGTTRKVEQMQWDHIRLDATCNKCTYQKRRETYRENHPDKIKEPKEKVPYDTERRKLAAQKAKQTNLDKFGVDNPAKAQCIKDKIKQKNLDKYGVDHPTKLQSVQEKRKQTCLDKYGVAFPMQNAESRAKNLENGFKNKTIIRDGKVFTYQGFEDAGIEKLISDGYKVEDIFSEDEISKDEDIPMFMYEYNGTMHRYYPDLMIWSEGKFIEVKSEFTYSNDTKRVYAKAQAVKRHGFDIEIWVYTCKKELVNIINV